ncbi:MAG: hypothetical protein PHV68_01495 [Candidatus Gastranaerophilales bacterium]|nr:hypothetical protein [Candidatus Gastranaerophilales bacterium]
MSFFKVIGDINSNSQRFEDWETQQDINDKKREKYFEQKQLSEAELAKAKQLGERIIDSVELMDQKSEDAAEDVETATIPLVSLGSMAGMFAGGAIDVGIFKFLTKVKGIKFSELIDSYDKIKEMKITPAQKELLDKLPKYKNLSTENTGIVKKLRNGYNYINGAITKEILDNKILEGENKQFLEKLHKNLSGGKKAIIAIPLVFIASMVVGTIASAVAATKLQVQGSKVARYQAREDLKDAKNFVMYTPEQIAQAQKIKETLPPDEEKKVNISNMGPIGYFKKLGKLISDNKKYEEQAKNSTKWQEKDLTNEELIEAKQQQKILNRTVKKINNQAEEYSENMETTAGVLFGSSFLLGGIVGTIADKILKKLNVDGKITEKITKKFENNKLLKKLKLDENTIKNLTKGIGSGKAMKIFGVILATLISAPIVLGLQKSASRIGRYQAKQELAQNPGNFIAINDEELEKIEVEKPKKDNFFSRIAKTFLVLPETIKNYKKYKDYQKNELEDKKKSLKALSMVEISENQMADAERLRNRVFKTFDKVDENSQEYSEEIEMANETALELAPLAMYASIIVPVITGIGLFASGKISSIKLASMATGIISKLSTISKKSLPNAIDNISDKALKIIDNHKINKFNLNNKNLDELTQLDLFKQLFKNFGGEIKFDSKTIRTSLNNTADKFKGDIEKMTPEEFTQFTKTNPVFKLIHDESAKPKEAVKLITNIQKIINNIPDEKLKEVSAKITEEFQKNPDKFIDLLQNEPKKLLSALNMQSILGSAYAGFIGINIFTLYIIQASLADMQKKAGRLGVMTAIDDLDKEINSIKPVNNTPKSATLTQTETGSPVRMEDFLNQTLKKKQN